MFKSFELGGSRFWKGDEKAEEERGEKKNESKGEKTHS